MDDIYVELKENAWGIEINDYDKLPTNASGVKIAQDMPNGTQLEVYDATSGKIVKYAEAIKAAWYER